MSCKASSVADPGSGAFLTPGSGMGTNKMEKIRIRDKHLGLATLLQLKTASLRELEVPYHNLFGGPERNLTSPQYEPV